MERPPTTTVGELIGNVEVDAVSAIPEGALVLDALVIFHVQHPDSQHVHTYQTSTWSLPLETEVGMLTSVLAMKNEQTLRAWGFD